MYAYFLLMFIICIIANCIGMDPVVLMFYLCAGMMAIAIPIMIFDHFYMKAWLKKQRAEKIPGSMSLAEYMAYLDKQIEEKKNDKTTPT